MIVLSIIKSKIIEQVLSGMSNKELIEALEAKEEQIFRNDIGMELLKRLKEEFPLPKSETVVSEQNTPNNVKNEVQPLFAENVTMTESQETEILVLLREGEPIEDIAMAYEVPVEYVAKFTKNRKKVNVSKYRHTIKNQLIRSVKKLPIDIKERILYLLKQNISASIIGTRFHVLTGSIAMVKAYMQGTKKVVRISHRAPCKASVIIPPSVPLNLTKKGLVNKIKRVKTPTYLNESQVREIIELAYSGENVYDIADAYKIHVQTVYDIMAQRTWKWIDRVAIQKNVSQKKKSQVG